MNTPLMIFHYYTKLNNYNSQTLLNRGNVENFDK